jgi:hypothetical protein
VAVCARDRQRFLERTDRAFFAENLGSGSAKNPHGCWVGALFVRRFFTPRRSVVQIHLRPPDRLRIGIVIQF